MRDAVTMCSVQYGVEIVCLYVRMYVKYNPEKKTSTGKSSSSYSQIILSLPLTI
jgi:hypothetical protein